MRASPALSGCGCVSRVHKELRAVLLDRIHNPVTSGPNTSELMRVLVGDKPERANDAPAFQYDPQTRVGISDERRQNPYPNTGGDQLILGVYA